MKNCKMVSVKQMNKQGELALKNQCIFIEKDWKNLVFNNIKVNFNCSNPKKYFLFQIGWLHFSYCYNEGVNSNW